MCQLRAVNLVSCRGLLWLWPDISSSCGRLVCAERIARFATAADSDHQSLIDDLALLDMRIDKLGRRIRVPPSSMPTSEEKASRPNAAVQPTSFEIESMLRAKVEGIERHVRFVPECCPTH